MTNDERLGQLSITWAFGCSSFVSRPSSFVARRPSNIQAQCRKEVKRQDQTTASPTILEHRLSTVHEGG